jgi:hypothetical protein
MSAYITYSNNIRCSGVQLGHNATSGIRRSDGDATSAFHTRTYITLPYGVHHMRASTTSINSPRWLSKTVLLSKQM